MSCEVRSKIHLLRSTKHSYGSARAAKCALVSTKEEFSSMNDMQAVLLCNMVQLNLE